MSTQYSTAGVDSGAGKSQSVEVPLNRKALAPRSPERVRRLRKHLIASLRALRTMKDPVGSASPLRPEPDGFAARVARAACTLCRGSCCKGGGDHAYLDERTMARVRLARMELDARAVLRIYLENVPTSGYDGSCIFHGAAGCTLDRSLRSDVCNSFYCTGLGNYLKGGNPVASIVVTARDGDELRRSQILTPP